MVRLAKYNFEVAKSIGMDEATRRQQRREQYYRKVLPGVLEQHLGYPLMLIAYSREVGVISVKRNRKDSSLIALRSKKEIPDFMNRTGRWDREGTAAFTKGLIDFYVVFNDKRKTRLGIFDVDLKDLPEKRARAQVLAIEKELHKRRFKTLICFSGSGYHIWFKGTGLRSYPNVREKIIFPIIDKLKLRRAAGKAHVEGAVTIDYATNSPNRPIRVPLTLHQRGLVDIPLTPQELKKFDPAYDAHPDIVQKNLKKYIPRIKAFFPRHASSNDADAHDNIHEDAELIPLLENE